MSRIASDQPIVERTARRRSRAADILVRRERRELAASECSGASAAWGPSLAPSRRACAFRPVASSSMPMGSRRNTRGAGGALLSRASTGRGRPREF